MPAGTNILSGWTFSWEGQMYEFGNITYIGIVRIFVGNVANLSSLCPFQLRRCSSTSPNVCVCVCPSVRGQPENLPSYILPQQLECSRMSQNVPESSRKLQKVPECSRMHAESSKMFQNACRKFQNVSEFMQNVPKCMQNVLESNDKQLHEFQSVKVSCPSVRFLTLNNVCLFSAFRD